MAVIRPFRGIVYDFDRVGPAEKVVAPPYDVIDSAEQERLYDASPYNVVRLDLSREADRYVAAAETYADWIGSGVLRRDAEPALYAYAQRFALPSGEVRDRWGVFARLRLEEFSAGVVLPHEKTHGAAKADRLALMHTTGANLSPIFGLFSAPGWSLEGVLGASVQGTPLAEARGGQAWHRFWRVADPEVHRAVAAQLEDRRIYIADGHHRYETALNYRRERVKQTGEGPDGPADHVLAFLANMDEPGLVVLPTNRLIRDSMLPPDRLIGRLMDTLRVEQLPDNAGPQAIRAALRAQPGERRIGLVVRDDERRFVLVSRDGEHDERLEGPLALRRLDVSLLHRLVFDEVLHLDAHEAADAGGLSYTISDDEVVERVDSGEFALGFLLNATGLDEVREVCEAGATMPEKSTYFFPKLLTGLVFNSVEDD